MIHLWACRTPPSHTSNCARVGSRAVSFGLPSDLHSWGNGHLKCLQKIKDLIAKTAFLLLRYYNRTKPVIVQADASKRGLSACLLQEGQSIAFASKSVTDTETRYTNIERELLAIVFASKHFNTYMYWEGQLNLTTSP